MGKIYYMMGKSSSGKDTLFKDLSLRIPALKTVVPYTTRPIREGEQNGVEYHFVTEEVLQGFMRKGRVIELRVYHTVHGIWKYFTADDGQIRLSDADYLMIGTLESYEKIRNYYGAGILVPLYVEVEDGERLIRAIIREQKQKQPRYAELCRRFLADAADFEEERIQALGITRRFCNTDKRQCVEEMAEVILNGKL